MEYWGEKDESHPLGKREAGNNSKRKKEGESQNSNKKTRREEEKRCGYNWDIEKIDSPRAMIKQNSLKEKGWEKKAAVIPSLIVLRNESSMHQSDRWDGTWGNVVSRMQVIKREC